MKTLSLVTRELFLRINASGMACMSIIFPIRCFKTREGCLEKASHCCHVADWTFSPHQAIIVSATYNSHVMYISMMAHVSVSPLAENDSTGVKITHRTEIYMESCTKGHLQLQNLLLHQL